MDIEIRVFYKIGKAENTQTIRINEVLLDEILTNYLEREYFSGEEVQSINYEKVCL